MSPNGRRAWREWVRRQGLRRKYKQPKGSVCRMARQARRHIPMVPGVMLPKPLIARSLVGMTMGARKRAIARCEQVDTDPVHRMWFRLGQRLRPCPGCCTCKGKPLTSRLAKKVGRSVLARLPNLSKTHWVCGVLIMKDGWDYGIMHREDDGSGVLPARKSK